MRAAGAQVFAINPLSSARHRERHSTSGAKSDAADAHVLAAILGLDHNLIGSSPGTPTCGCGELVARAHRGMPGACIAAGGLNRQPAQALRTGGVRVVADAGIAPQRWRHVRAGQIRSDAPGQPYHRLTLASVRTSGVSRLHSRHASMRAARAALSTLPSFSGSASSIWLAGHGHRFWTSWRAVNCRIDLGSSRGLTASRCRCCRQRDFTGTRAVGDGGVPQSVRRPGFVHRRVFASFSRAAGSSHMDG